VVGDWRKPGARSVLSGNEMPHAEVMSGPRLPRQIALYGQKFLFVLDRHAERARAVMPKQKAMY